MVFGTSISKLQHFLYEQDNTPKPNIFDKKMGKNTVKPLPTSLDPPWGWSQDKPAAPPKSCLHHQPSHVTQTARTFPMRLQMRL